MIALKRCANVQHGASPFQRPSHSTPFHAVFYEVTACPLDDARRNRVTTPQIFVISHPVSVLLQVPTDPRQIFRCLPTELRCRPQASQPTDHASDLATQNPQQSLTRELPPPTFVSLEQPSRLPEVNQHVQDIEDRDGPRSKREMQLQSLPSALLAIHHNEQHLPESATLADLADDPRHRHMDTTDVNLTTVNFIDGLRHMSGSDLIRR